MKSEDDGRRPERDRVAGCTMLPRYAGQRPVTTVGLGLGLVLRLTLRRTLDVLKQTEIEH